MTPEQRSMVLALVTRPGGGAPSPPPELLRAFGASDGVALGLDLLRDAVARRDPVDVELALVVAFAFGFSAAHRPLLVELASAEWHERHEDVVTALRELGDGSPDTVTALVHLATWVPGYLDYDDGRALARKAVHALGALHTEAADQALEELAASQTDPVATWARARRER